MSGVIWHRAVLEALRRSSLFASVALAGAKVRGTIDSSRFLDIYFDPATKSYSYALIDLALPYPGDKRVFGWDDYPHEHVPAIAELMSHPHHFQRRDEQGQWIFEESPMRGNLQAEMPQIIEAVRQYLGR